MGQPIEECRLPLRIALGDDPSAITPSYTDEQLDSIIMGAIQMGLAPECVGLSDDKTKLDPAPPNNETFGYLILKAAHMALGGDTPVNVKTRAMQVSVNPNARRDTLRTIEMLIHQLEQKGNICGTSESSTVMASSDCATYMDKVLLCPYQYRFAPA